MRRKELLIAAIKKSYKSIANFSGVVKIKPSRMRSFVNGTLKRGLYDFEFIRICDELSIRPDDYELLFKSQIPQNLKDRREEMKVRRFLKDVGII